MAELPGKREKYVLGFLVFLGTLALILGFLQLSGDIKGPYAKKAVSSQNPQPALEKSEMEKIVELQLKDTDKDGLSDYQEMYVHNTSPYLEDTDSDGDNDKKEIDNGDNPNCPKGKTCREVETDTNTNAAVPFAPEFFANTNTQIGSVSGLSNLLPSENMSVSDLRQLLKQSGMTDEQLNQIDDATLKQLYQETLKGFTAGQTPTKQTPGGDINSLKEGLQDLSAEQIRNLLKQQGGMTGEQLSQIDDATLKQFYKETLEKME